jgi:DNA polymerase V
MQTIDLSMTTTQVVPVKNIMPCGVEENNYFDLNKRLIQNRLFTYFMKVNSDVMKEAGINKGDMVIVDRSLQPTNGNVIIAQVNGDMLVRRFEKTRNSIQLVTDSNKLSPILIENKMEGFAVWGVVTYVIHSI